MPRARGNGGYRPGNGPPGKGPPGGDPPEDQPTPPDDDDPQNQIIAFIHAIVGQQLDQRLGEIEDRFKVFDDNFHKVAEAINELKGFISTINDTVQSAQVASNGRAPMELAIPEASQAPQEMPAGAGVAGVLVNVLNTITANPKVVSDAFAAFAQARASMRAPDVYAALRYYKETNPEAFYAFVPDALGGRFPEVITKAVQTGINIGVSGKGGTSPLVNPSNGSSGGPSASPPDTSNPPTPSGGAVSLASLSDEEIELGIAQLAMAKMSRQAA